MIDIKIATVVLDHTLWHKHTHSVGLLWMGYRSVAETCTWQHTTLSTDIHGPGGNQSCNSSKRAATNPRLRPRGHEVWRPVIKILFISRFVLVGVKERGHEKFVSVNNLWSSGSVAGCTPGTVHYLQRSLPHGTQSYPVTPLDGYWIKDFQWVSMWLPATHLRNLLQE